MASTFHFGKDNQLLLFSLQLGGGKKRKRRVKAIFACILGKKQNKTKHITPKADFFFHLSLYLK